MNLSTRDPILIGLAGRAGVGKTTAAQYLRRDYDFEVVNYADALKDMLEVMLADRHVDHAVLHEPELKGKPQAALRGHSARTLMQRLGDWGRDIHPQWWIDQLAYRIGMAAPTRGQWAPIHDRIVIGDVRYPNESAWIQDRGGVVILITRPGCDGAASHSSEASLDLIDCNATIHNDGPTLLGLYAHLDRTMRELGVSCRPGHAA